jgi:hypothetical protein
MDGELASDAALAEVAESPAVEATSTEYLGRWNRLVSTTNWEKGRIICEWREALITADASPTSYSDEAWSRRAGGVSPQHTGRLRRVYQRFGEVRDQYAGLYWSHFQASLDWSDAEMWLEGAVQNEWTVAQMQDKRRATLGSLENTSGEDAPAVELDEDAPSVGRGPLPEEISSSVTEVHGTSDALCETDHTAEEPREPTGLDHGDDFADEAPSPFRPLENLPSLPADLAEAFEAFKLAIVHHRLAGWREVSCDDVLAALDALRQLTLAPA